VARKEKFVITHNRKKKLLKNIRRLILTKFLTSLKLAKLISMRQKRRKREQY